MLVLAIDTATEVSSVAVISENRLLAEINKQAALTHSTTLMPHIKEVLELAGVKKADLTGIAVSIGPGSFTGLRIGVATAKAMAYALNIPIVGIGTLTSLAYHYQGSTKELITLIDAQKGNVYTESFTWENDKLISLKPLRVIKLEECLRELGEGENSRQVTLLGEVEKLITKKGLMLAPNIHLSPLHLRMPRAALIALASLTGLKNGDTDNIMLLEPLYIRRSEAEVLWEMRHSETK